MSNKAKRIGIIGGGQLGKMMILEAKRLGFYIVTFDPSAACPSHSISDELIVAPFDDESAYRLLASKTDLITYEYEHIHAHALLTLEQNGYQIYPSAASLITIQNKHTQKLTLCKNGIPVPRFAAVHNISDIRALGGCDGAFESTRSSPDDINTELSNSLSQIGEKPVFGYPLMLKTTLGGYDGKGNALIASESEIADAFASLGGGMAALMAEEFVAYDKEISIIATRGIDGSRVVYPPAENSHKNSILDTTIVPARIPHQSMKKAEEIAHNVMEVFEGVGTFCVEMFLTETGDVLVNEVAPRPHNSGHYTIEGCLVNQFENHIRAITGLPLGNVSLIHPTVMINILGESEGPARLAGLAEAYSDPNIHIHLYGKSESKPDRKMGHLTAVGNDAEDALRRAKRAKNAVRVSGSPKE